MSVTHRFSGLYYELEVHKPVFNLCLMAVCPTTSEKMDKLHTEKGEEVQHEIPRLFMFCATANAKVSHLEV